MNETQEKPKWLASVRSIVLGVVLCAGIGIACFIGGRSSAGQESTHLDAVVVQNQLSQINELTSVVYRYTNMAQFENSNDFYGVRIPFTTKKFILSYDGEIKAGIDLTQATVKVSENQVQIRLPQAEVLSHEIEEESVEVFDERTSIFNPFTVEDFTSFQDDQKEQMEQKAIEKGLLLEAGTKARENVETFLQAALPEEYTLQVSAPDKKTNVE